jgi:uncharacterized protein
MCMTTLPLFPLNTVLFPGIPISLHIFEERYKLMIDDCIAERQPFGVVPLQKGTAEYHPGQEIIPYSMGCSAQIAQVQPVGDGRMNITAIGQQRFQILELDHTQPYLMGVVETLPIIDSSTAANERSTRQLRPMVERYLNTLAEIDDNTRLNEDDLPSDALQLAYLAVSLLKTSVDDKLKVLSAQNALEVVNGVIQLYRKEVALLETLSQQPELPSEGPFSMN